MVKEGFLLFAVFGLCIISQVLGSCDTFATKCSTQIGRVLGNVHSDEDIFNLTETSEMYFSFTQPADFPSVKILSSVYYGNIEMFVSFGQEVSSSKYSIRTDKGFQDILEVGSNIGGSSREVNVMLKAMTIASVRVIATTSSTSTALQRGLPQVDKVLRGGQNTYTFVAASTTPLNLVITPFINGDPNIRVTGPGSNPREWTSEDVGADSVLITPLESEVGQTFTVTVPSLNMSYYSIAVSESSSTAPTTLLGGFPLEDAAEAGVDLFYVLHVPPGEADAVFMVSPVYGDADIYVNPQQRGFHHYDASEDPSSATWSSELTYGTDSVVIDKADESFLHGGGVYYVTIHATSACKFVLRGFSAETVITLTEGSSIVDTVSAKSYHYYRFVNGDPSQDVVLDVSPLTGDPDLLVGCVVKSTGDNDGYPSQQLHHSNYSSVRGGEDTVLIRAGDPRACPSNIYYLAVYAFSTSRFSLTATRPGGTVTLQDGVPVSSSAPALIGKFFRYAMGPEAMQLTISLTPGTEDLDLYVSTGGPVSRYVHDFKSDKPGTSPDQVVISETEGCVSCDVNIFVYGIATSRFSIVASLEDTTIQLANAKPLKEAVAQDYIQYYTLQASENGTANVVLTVLSGMPELYLSTKVEKPSRSTSDTIVNDMASVGNLPVAFVDVHAGDTLYIGVGGAGTNATYTVRAHIRVPGIDPLLRMLEAIPQGDALGMNGPDWNYYQINVPAGHESISLRATALVGNIDLFVMKCPFQTSECAGTHTSAAQSYLPTESNFELTTMGAADDYLMVTRSDDEAVSYIVGVDSNSMYAEYHISMSMDNSILALSPGTPITDHAEDGEYDYFSVFAEDKPQLLSIRLTPLAGDVDLFVSTSVSRPNETSYMWKSRKFGEDSIVIDTDLDAKACTGCTYYIAVYGYRAGTYSLMAGTESTVGRLLDGVPISSSVGYFQYQRFTFKNNFGIARNFKIMVTALSGTPALYVTLDGSVPSFTRYDYFASTWSSSTSINILSADEKYAPCIEGECDIRVAVYGLMASSFSLSITSSEASTFLRMGVPIQASVGQRMYDYFKVSLPESRGGIRLSLSEYSGTTIMYVSCHTKFPNSTVNTHDWFYMPSGRSSAAYLELDGLDLMDHSCPETSSFIYMSVYGVSSATYSLTASVPGNETIPRLIPGLAVREYVPFHEFDYFYYRPTSDNSNNLRIIVSSLQGDVDVFVSASWSTRPTYSQTEQQVVSYVLHSAEIGGENLLITKNDIASMCEGRGDECYIVIGVYGAYDGHGVGSGYRIELSLQDATVTLSSGQSVQSRLADHATDYYKYTVTSSDKDVVISVTALSGDPDVFVGVEPIHHPSYTNYTWMTAYWGADTLTIQHEELASHCAAVPEEGKNCELYIAIFAWKNCSYTIVARMDEGSDHPVALIDGQPQSGFVALGSYTYYTFYISSHEGQLVPASLLVTLTSSEGDQDMYLTMNDDVEPGRNNYDYMSANFGGVSDEIEVGVGMSHYCMNCFVKIAVYGFKEGHFSVTATSKGVQQLQSGVAMGGHLEQGKYRYYSFRNTNPTAQITVSLTPISGDPDLYMNVYGVAEEGKEYEFPRNFHYTWRSIHAGNDEVSFNYADESFCVDCTYVVGIYSFRNSSYTLLMTDSEDAVVTLVSNRPQIVHITDANKVSYFRATSLTSAEDLTVSLTNMASSDHVPMYISHSALSMYNGTFPDISDPSTYSYTNALSNADSVFIRENLEEPQMYVIAVKPPKPTMVSIMFSSAARSITLQSGVPQSHYVAKGSMALFRYYLNEYEDIQVSISAVSGDPDLFLSATQTPHCEAAGSYYSVKCSNYTWSSTSYSTDQVIISKDMPCTPVMPGTHVASECKVSDFHLGALTIGVYGFSTSRFYIMATPRGRHVTLLSGKPQLAYTSLGYVCSDRDEGNGACLASSSRNDQQSVAYFSFSFSADSKVKSENNIIFTVVPSCNASRTSGTSCQPGCDCDPVGVYITSCPISKCTATDKFPSYIKKRSKASLTIEQSSLSILIPPDSEAYCSPEVHGEPCMYYAAVISKQKDEQVAFTISVDTPGDVALISCDSTPSPDGFRLTRSSTLGSGHSEKLFELCSKSGDASGASPEQLVVSVEECYGSVDMYACSEDPNYCDSFLPTDKSWQFFADSSRTCQRKKKHSTSASCSDNLDGYPLMSLPEKNGNYNIKVNGTGQFYFTVQNTHNGELLAPALKFDGYDQSAANKVSVVHAGGTSLTLSWKHLRVLMPGEKSPAATPNIRYRMYVFEKGKLDQLSKTLSLVTTTPCGLDYAASRMETAAQVISIPVMDSSKDEMEHVVNGLQRNMEYYVALVGQCDASCLRQVSKVSYSSLMSCAGGSDCKEQEFVFQSLDSVRTSKKGGGGGDGGSGGDNSLNGFILLSLVIVIATVMALFGVYSYYTSAKKEMDNLSDFEMTDFSNDTAGSVGDVFSFGSPPATSKGPSQSPSALSSTAASMGKSMLSRLGNLESGLFSSYAPLIREDQQEQEDEEITVNL